MSEDNRESQDSQSRRQFLARTTTGVVGASVLTNLPFVHAAPLAATRDIKIGLIGCGGRGTGAALNAIGAATKVIYPQLGYHTEDAADGARMGRDHIQVVAMADLFEDRVRRCYGELAKVGVDVPKSRCFVGFDAYKELLADPNVNYVIQATPPRFRPTHLLAAIEAGKNVFIEKPAAVDVPGVKMVMKAGQLAKEKGLGIAAGTQRRHQGSYQETIKRIRDGAIGDIAYAKCYWNGGQIWVVDREAGWSDIEWQIRNWNYFTWLSGDHIVEQHVHNLDIMNWALGSHPIKAVSGLGGRQVRVGDRHGHIFDHFAGEFEYPGGVSMFSQSRQINGCQGKVEEFIAGTGGSSNCRNRIYPKGQEEWRFPRRDERAERPYEQEHMDLIASIRAGNPINVAQTVAESTMTGIIGREAVYSGQPIEWDAAMKSETRLGPEECEFGSYPIPAVAMPGSYRFV